MKQTLRDEAERKSTTTREDEKTNTERVKLVSPDFSYGGVTIGGGPEKETTTVDRNLLKNEYGITLKVTKDRTVWEPASIATYRLSAGSQKLDQTVRDVVFLGVGSADDYFEETDVPCTFTMAKVGFTGRTDAERYYDGVPIGTVLPYFGVKPPPGYVWFDKTSTWPDELWVRVELRGKAMPDTNGFLLGGTNDIAKVGASWTAGKLTIPAFTIAGSSFSMPPETKSEIGTISFLVPSVGPSQRASGNYSSYRYAGAISGSKTVGPVSMYLDGLETNPRHIMCRWIIRVK